MIKKIIIFLVCLIICFSCKQNPGTEVEVVSGTLNVKLTLLYEPNPFSYSDYFIYIWVTDSENNYIDTIVYYKRHGSSGSEIVEDSDLPTYWIADAGTVLDGVSCATVRLVTGNMLFSSENWDCKDSDGNRIEANKKYRVKVNIPGIPMTPGTPPDPDSIYAYADIILDGESKIADLIIVDARDLCFTGGSVVFTAN